MLKLIDSIDSEILSNLADTFAGLVADTSGATAIEYGLIAALIAVAAVGAMSGLGSQISKTLNNTTSIMAQG